MNSNSSLKPRKNRVAITPLHQIYFKSKSSSGELMLELANISVTGMALLHAKKTNWQEGQEIEGILGIQDQELSVKSIIRHISDDVAGVEFAGDTPLVVRAITNYLKIEILALDLRQVNPAYLKPDSRGVVVWLTDGKQNEIFCVASEDEVIDFHLSFLGNYIEGGKRRPARGGMIRRDEDVEDPEHKRSEMINMSKGLAPELRMLATTFVQNTAELKPTLREQLSQLLQN